jgi:hypothetical protein
VVFEDALGVAIAFDYSGSEVLIGYNDKELLGIPEVCENLALEKHKVGRDTAFAKTGLQGGEEVLRSIKERVGD